MKKIAVDLRSLETPTGKRGVGYYNRHTFEKLLKITHLGMDFSLFTFPKSNLSREFKIAQEDRFSVVPALYWPKRGLRRLDLLFSVFWKNTLNSLKPDLLHLPFVFDVYHLSIPEDIKTIITIYDVIPLIFPKQYFRNKKAEDWYRHRFIEVKKAVKIITISESSKKDIIKFLGIPANKIKVIYGGVDEKFRVISRGGIKDVLKKYRIKMPYILTVSTHSFHKNINRIFQAFRELNSDDLNLAVVCKLTFDEEKDWRDQLEKLGIQNKVILTNFVSDQELVSLYNGAEVFLFPSLYEGLGLPVLEAFACGVPVITSKVSSLPEVGGDAPVYVDPENLDEIKKALIKVIGNEKIKSEMIRKGFAQVKKFSWEKTAEETLDLYKDVLQSH